MEWVSTTALAKLAGISPQAMYKRIKAGKYSQVREVAGAVGQGGKQFEVAVACLPQAVQQRVLQERDHALAVCEDQAGSPGVQGQLTEIAAWQLAEAARRERIVAAWLEDLGMAGMQESQKARAERFVRDYKQAFPSETLCRASLLSWVRAYASDGKLGLVPQATRRGGAGGLSISEGVAAVIQEQYLTQARRKIATVYDRITEYCLSTLGDTLPSQTTVARYIGEQYPPAVQTYFREGQGKWRSIIEPILHRDYSALPVNGLWCSDQRTMDTMLKVWHGNKYLYKRPTLTLIIDVKSATAVGWYCGFETDAYTIALAARHGFKRFGLPSGFYFDCGKNYKSIYLNGRTQRFEESPYTLDLNKDTKLFLDAKYPNERDEIQWRFAEADVGLFQMLEIGVHHSRPVNRFEPGKASSGVARAKPVEPYFNLFHQFEQELPGWCGHNTLALPEKLKREIAADQLFTLPEYLNLLAAYIEKLNQQCHGWRNVPSLQFYHGFQAVFARERDLDLLMKPKKRVMVKHSEVALKQSSGCGVEFLPGLFYSSPELALLSGTYVTVWYDPLDLSEITITQPDGKFVCVIQKTALQGWLGSATKAQYKAVYKKKKAARQAMEGQKDHRHVLDYREEDLLAENLRQQDQEVIELQAVANAPEKAVVKMLPGGRVADEIEAQRATLVQAKLQAPPPPVQRPQLYVVKSENQVAAEDEAMKTARETKARDAERAVRALFSRDDDDEDETADAARKAQVRALFSRDE